jgi:hypothetical protein
MSEKVFCQRIFLSGDFSRYVRVAPPPEPTPPVVHTIGTLLRNLFKAAMDTYDPPAVPGTGEAEVFAWIIRSGIYAFLKGRLLSEMARLGSVIPSLRESYPEIMARLDAMGQPLWAFVLAEMTDGTDLARRHLNSVTYVGIPVETTFPS